MAARPEDDGTPVAELAERLTNCLAELHMLSKLPRLGWVLAGVREPESVAIHCYETALFAYLIAQQLDEPVDLEKVLVMALFHETGEVRATDLPRRSSPYLKHAKGPAEEAATQDVLHGVGEAVLPLLEEFHAGETLEARVTEAAEELQIVFAAMMYAKENNGDMAEYRRDADRYDPQGIGIAEEVAQIVKRRLGDYLGDRPYWELGYDRPVSGADSLKR